MVEETLEDLNGGGVLEALQNSERLCCAAQSGQKGEVT